MRELVVVMLFVVWGGTLWAGGSAQPTFRGFLAEDGLLVPNCLIGLCLPVVMEASAPLESPEPVVSGAKQEPEKREGFVDGEAFEQMGFYQRRLMQEQSQYRDRVSRHRESYRKRMGEFDLLR